ncbi:2-dehydro-3-deoxygalactonokinase [Wenyingzhuangia sp. 2_MG-2023]|uniref:2-dehydro-3-deoxygalactonokinase n=1 Tax=Wenyingzhuangia sp. 2_MG-2023 TaxID=3062639 RepID=UPI0026E28F87|nr:2-dehydro-3-deoxygalactonokinase [Wenyingzhuangia sp. 2_MG-2023]MDO6738668.1 2-dehydro-3-deoxygalactonokinase [Wenyingzhuangia sp. 2_MG-2023]
MSLPKTFISCDWGTSNFRLRLVNSENLEVIAEHSTDIGVKKRYLAYQESDKSISQTSFFVRYLKEQINVFSAFENTSKVVASGMTTASIGMFELPYVDMPIYFDGSNLHSKVITESNLDIILVSGAKTATDVMRGEEIQAIGLSKQIPNNKEGVLLLPGTHSKHVEFKNGKFTSFTTHMTGELFDVLRKNTLLSNSLTKADWDPKFEPSFLEGVAKGLNNQHLSSLFSIRANDLLGNKTKEENFYFLSGLLIGGELAYLTNSKQQVYIATTGILYKLYNLALQQLAQDIVCFDADVIDKALLIGHKKTLELYV